MRVIFGGGSAVGSLTFAKDEPVMPEKSRFAGGFLGIGFLIIAVITGQLALR